MIFVECNADALLARSATRLRDREVVHAGGGKGRVLNKLSRTQGAKGLIDEDPGSTQPGTLAGFALVEDLPDSGLRRLREGASANELVMLRPALEEWLIASAREARIDMVHFSLPNDPRGLHRVGTLYPERLTPLFEALQEARSERWQTLGAWLRPAPRAQRVSAKRGPRPHPAGSGGSPLPR
ncbi:MAG: hypothetical protein HY688_05400 [Chloroflexi bacterium]|nr:hypothetical protein [Chloroflexota bacterium]